MKAKNKKLIIFDFDGPIVDSWFLSYQRGKRDWPHLTKEKHRRLFSGNTYEELEKLGERTQSKKERDQWLENFYWPSKLNLSPIAGIQNALDRLKGVNMVIVSYSSNEFIQKYLKKYDLLRYFKDIFGPETSESKKQIFKIVLRKYKIGAENTILVTDTIGDLLEAQELGIRVLLVTWGYQRKKHFKDHKDVSFGVVDRIDELEKNLKKFLIQF